MSCGEEVELLCEDSEDDWALSERAAKRRRIAKRADEYLNGFDLDIASARLDPAAFTQAISYSFSQPRHAACALAAANLDSGYDIEEDVTDLWQVLKAHNDLYEELNPDQPTVLDDSGILAMACEETVAEVQAQSSCNRRRSRRLIRLALGPSEDALRRAAELRNHRLRQTIPEIAETPSQSCSRRFVEETQPDSLSIASTDQDTTTFSDGVPSPTPAWTSSKWLRTRAFQPPAKRVDEDCSKDELGLSSFTVASQRARTRAVTRSNTERNAVSQPSFPTETAGQTSTGKWASFTSAPRGTGRDDDQANLSAIAEGDSAQTNSGAHLDTALENAHEDAMPVVPAESQLQGESQTQLFIREGILAKPRQSWASMNDAKIANELQSAAEEDPASIDNATVPCSMRESIQQITQKKAGKRVKNRSTKSTGNTPIAAAEQPRRRSHRRRTAPSESQKAIDEAIQLPLDQHRGTRALRSAYNESVEGKNSSPFVFRKKASKLAKNDDTNAASTTMNEQEHAKLPATTPREAVKFPSDDDSGMGKDPRTPLVNEHLNSILPMDRAGARRSGSLRSSLRNEMQALGAEMSRAENDQSLQPEAPSPLQGQLPLQPECSENVSSHQPGDAADDENVASPRVIVVAEPPCLLPGTQAMLDQAHHDLFTSPDKTDTALYLGDKSTPCGLANVAKPFRKPLGALSQERLPMPSTQAFINDWQGWSSIKKPREPGKRTSFDALHSPTISKEHPPTIIASNSTESAKRADRRKSSLRHSMSFAESPFKATDPKPSSLPAQSTTQVPNTASRHGQLSFSAPKPSGKIASSASFSFEGEPSSLQQPIASKAPSGPLAASIHPQSTTINNPDSLSFGPHPRHPLSEHSHDLSYSDHDLSFAAPLAQPDKTPSSLAPPTQDPTVFEQVSAYDLDTTTGIGDYDSDPVPSYIRNGAPTPSYVRRDQDPGPSTSKMSASSSKIAAHLEFDSQELAGAVNDLTGDVLGSACEFTF